MGTVLSGKVALVTGASSGIGRAIVQLLAGQGMRVFGTSRSPDAELIRLDVTDDASVTQAVQSVLQGTDHLDVLVNNAGYALVGALEETSIAEAQAQFDTNLFGVLRMIRAVLPAMRRQGSGRIVNISSVAGIVPLPFQGIYAASKHALEGYTETLDHEVRQFGIRAALIEPTFTKTAIEVNSKTARESLDA
jgi:NAD(P)-dependent dehydrogenase (short-subunit alcohol dehydrogenase family)